MYYEEKVINGVLHCRTAPNREWRPMSPEALTQRITMYQQQVAQLEEMVDSLSEANAAVGEFLQHS